MNRDLLYGILASAILLGMYAGWATYYPDDKLETIATCMDDRGDTSKEAYLTCAQELRKAEDR